MISSVMRFFAALAASIALAGPAAAQSTFTPQVGQPGKDVIWVPTPDDVVDRMLRMAQTTAGDFVVDLGSGDGKIVIAAAKKFGARSLGVEFNPDMVKLSQRNADAAGVAQRATFRQADIFATDYSQATVVTLYLLPSLNLKLRPQLLSMRPGTRVVSHSFDMDDWQADEISVVEGKRAHLWIVPASVQGGWTSEVMVAGSPRRYDLNFDQRYQTIRGTVSLGTVLAGLREAYLRGPQISFSYVDDQGVRRDFSGAVTGSRMEGGYRADNGSDGRWSATRK
jgi:hypothetical protein